MATLNPTGLAAVADALATMPTQQPGPVRRAREWSACRHCTQPIQPGQRITRQPGRFWQHLDCHQPDGHRRRR